MATINYPNNFFLGAGITNPKVYYSKIKELIDATNNFIDGDDLTIPGDLVVTGTSTFNGAIILGDAAADSLTINATVTQGAPVNYSNATTITAGTTQTLAGATALTEEINNVTTVANAGDGVKLATAVAGLHMSVKNSGANVLSIWPGNSSDAIDALGVNGTTFVRLAPGSTMSFHAIDATTWESSLDNKLTLNSPTAATGQLTISAAASAGNTVTDIVNASQSGARTYTIPDAGASASFVMTEGAQTLVGVKRFSDPIWASAGSAAAPSITFTSDSNTGLISSAADSIGFVTNGVEKWVLNSSGAINPIIDNTYDIGNGTVNPRDINISRGVKAYGAALVGTPNAAGAITAVTHGDGRNFTTLITVPSVVDAITVADNAALAVGFLIYSLPAGAIVVNSAYMSMAVTLAEDTTSTADVGIGTIIGSGANAVLSGTGAGAENIITGQTAANCSGTATVKTVSNQVLTIETGDSHDIYFNVADTWADTAGIDLTGDIAGFISINWTKMSA